MKRLIAMVEDSSKDANDILSHAKRFSADSEGEIEVRWFNSGGEFLSQYHHNYDIVLMDINLSELNGMDVAKMLREIDNQVILIFVTSLAQYAVAGYEVSAFDFIVKPVDYPTFKRKIHRALACCPVSQNESILLSLREGIEYRITPSRIKYIEIQSHDILIHATEGNLVSYGNLKELESKLDPHVFIRCHRSYLVNLSFVTAVHGNSITVDGEELPLAKLKKPEFLQALNVHLRGRR